MVERVFDFWLEYGVCRYSIDINDIPIPTNGKPLAYFRIKLLEIVLNQILLVRA